MATVGRINGASFNNTPRLSYISTAAFNTYFYSYSTSINMDLETVGTLGPVAGATSGNCPKGRVLRENGRKLYPAANPGITTYLVGVYDAQTMLSGFIDPNAKVFQIYNTDKPTYLEDGVEPSGATTDLGPSVYTRGDILAQGTLDISGAAYIHGGERVDGGLTVYGPSVLATTTALTQSGDTALNLDCSLGNMFTITITSSTGFALNATNVSQGQHIYVIYLNPSSYTPSIVMGNNIRELWNGSGQDITFVLNVSITQQFIGYSGNLCELSRMYINGS